VAQDLVETMRAGPATVGLAAPQIGVAVRAFCLDVGSHPRATTSHGLVVLFDPERVEAHGEEVMREGCLSVPDFTASQAAIVPIRMSVRPAGNVNRNLPVSDTTRITTPMISSPMTKWTICG